MSIHLKLDASAPLATFASGDRWRVWTRGQATVALCLVVGFRLSEYALKFGLHRGGDKVGGSMPVTCRPPTRRAVESEAFVHS